MMRLFELHLSAVKKHRLHITCLHLLIPTIFLSKPISSLDLTNCFFNTVFIGVLPLMNPSSLFSTHFQNRTRYSYPLFLCIFYVYFWHRGYSMKIYETYRLPEKECYTKSNPISCGKCMDMVKIQKLFSQTSHKSTDGLNMNYPLVN